MDSDDYGILGGPMYKVCVDFVSVIAAYSE